MNEHDDDLTLCTKSEEDAALEGNYGGLDLFASFPCPLKVPLETELQRLLAERRQAGTPLKTTLDGCNQIPLHDCAASLTDQSELPALILSSGVSSLLSHAFRSRFVASGLFHRWPEFPLPLRLASLGLTDPDSVYRVFAINLFIFVVDKSRIGPLRIPESWAELLDPIYEGTTAICGHNGRYNDSVLVSVLSMFGVHGLQRLGHTVKIGLHPAQFIKHLGSGRDETPAIAIVPLFFAKTARNQEDLTIVWPRDGALASPLYLLAKQADRDRLDDLAQFFTGRGVADICAGAFFPSLHPDASAAIPDDAPIYWHGWRYLTSNDPGKLQRTALELFTVAHEAAHAIP